MSISNPQSFRAEARYQRVCAVCGAAGAFHAHHVVPKTILRRLRLPLYDTRNALRLCTRCHMSYEWGGPGKIRLGVFRLTDDNLCYCWETLGPTIGMIERKYGGSFALDPRWLKHRMGECERCQLNASPQTEPTQTLL